MFHPGPAVLSIYKQNPGMLLFILHYSHSISSAFAQKLYSVTKLKFYKFFPIISSSAIASTCFSRFPLPYA